MDISEKYRFRKNPCLKYKGIAKFSTKKHGERYKTIICLNKKVICLSVSATDGEAAMIYDYAMDYLNLPGYRNFDKKLNLSLDKKVLEKLKLLKQSL